LPSIWSRMDQEKGTEHMRTLRQEGIWVLKGLGPTEWASEMTKLLGQVDKPSLGDWDCNKATHTYREREKKRRREREYDILVNLSRGGGRRGKENVGEWKTLKYCISIWR
jgi:hypothetical protein